MLHFFSNPYLGYEEMQSACQVRQTLRASVRPHPRALLVNLKHHT